MYNPNDKVQGYTIKDLITIGNNSVAYAASDASGRKVFFKMYQSPSVRVKWYRPFIDHQREMKFRIESGPCKQFCYQFLGGFEHARKYHQVFEFLDKSHSLDKILEKVRTSPGEVSWPARELMAKVLVAGISQLHAAGIVHADLKPDNIMLIEDPSIGMRYRLKIIDMDFSFFTDKKAPWHGFEGYFGTPGYMSPEHLQGKVPLPASDVFTLGIMLHQLLGPGHPYPFDDNEKFLPAYKAYAIEKPKLLGAPTPPANADAICEILHRCLHPEPAKRPHAAEVHRALLGERPPTPSGSILPPALRPMMPSESVPPPRPVEPTPSIAPAAVIPVAPPVRSEVLVAPRLVLVGASGAELGIGARLAVGRTILITKFGENGRFAADRQFILDRTEDGWFVEPVAGTPNATLLNGEVLETRTLLEPGATIAIGNAVSRKTKLELTVKSG
ncbi:MAG: protein kinase [Planctomycetia bacterium]|nr:protein kinase [Planctomycetia bacterium]